MSNMKKIGIVLLVVFSMLVSGIKNYTISSAEEERILFESDNFKVSIKIDSEWENYYSATVVIENVGNAKIENWSLIFESKDSIKNIWNAKIKFNSNNLYEISNLDWNKNIESGGTISFGYIAYYDAYKDIPNIHKVSESSSIISKKENTVSFEVVDCWDGGAVISVVIENKSEKEISGWEINFEAKYDIETIWNAVIVSNENGKYQIKNAGYNSDIKPHSKVTFGYKIKGEYIKENNILVSEISDNNKLETDKSIISDIQVANKTILTNTSYSSRIFVEIDDKNIDSDYIVNLYRYKNGKWVFCDYLYDSGELDEVGDEIKNDGIYSNIINLYELKAGDIKYKVVVVSDTKELDQKEVSINVIQGLESTDIEKYNQCNLLLKNYIDRKIKNLSKEINSIEIVEEIKELLSYEEISEVITVDEWTIKVIFGNGLSTYVQIADDSDMELMRRGENIEQEENSNTIIDPDTYEGEADVENENVADNYLDEEVEYLGDEDIDGEDIEESFQDYDYVLSNKVLVWNPFDTEWGENDETELVRSIVKQSPYGLDIDVISDADANISSLKKISDYGVIILASHGLEGKWLVTGEKPNNNSKYAKDLQMGNISVLIRGEVSLNSSQMLYMINSSWLEGNIDGDFPNSIIINNSCSSLATDDFWNMFKKKGAKTYYGYTGSVTNDYVVTQTQSLLFNLISKEESTQEAYDYSYDCQYGGEYFGIRGFGNILLPFGLMNADFEKGLSGWEKDGDGRIITKLGDIMPTQGDYMAIISTGLGYTKELGKISQAFSIPENAKELSFDWNFLSEEFLEYIGSQYKDPFEMSLILKDENNKKHTLLYMDVNTIASDFDATKRKSGKLVHVSPQIVFDRGDVWMTGWQRSKVDVLDFAGENVDLVFSVKDATDTIYTTAVLLDNLHFDAGNIVIGEPIQIANDYMDDTIRGIFSGSNKIGKSYVFYDGSNFSKQAERERKSIKYRYGYEKLSQIVMKKISTEKSFVDNWNNMNDSKKIDRVSLLFHGSFYAIMIDSDRNENLTTNPEGKVSSEDDATYIRNLSEKKIRMINILTCNGGVLDAINYDDNVSITAKGKLNTFKIKGNVAQAFLDSQNVDTVIAWDGSLSYVPYICTPRLSKSQEHFREKLKVLKKNRVCKPVRGTLVYNLVTGKKTNKDPNKPYGEIVYTRGSDGKFTCKYTYRYKKYFLLCVKRGKKTKTIDIKNLSYSS